MKTKVGNKSRLLALVAAAIPLLLCSISRAGVEDTHHDMSWITGRQGVDDPNSCSYCHVPRQVSKKAGVFDRVGVYNGEIDSLGAFCYNCHDGTVVPTALVEAPGGFYGVTALSNSHGFKVENLQIVTKGLEGPKNIALGGLVQLIPETGALPERFSCNACHNVHSNDYPPFLQSPIGELCTKCHSGSDGLGSGRWTSVNSTGLENGPHPIGMPLKDSGLDYTRGFGPDKVFHEPYQLYDVPMSAQEDLRYMDVHWDMGGHLIGADKIVTCATCHSAHLPAEDLLVALVAPDQDKEICSGCHGDGINPANPGLGNSYHPNFDEVAPPYVHDHATHAYLDDYPKSGTWDLYVSLPRELPLNEKNQVYCMTCHQPHQGRPGARCMRIGPMKAGVICNECHGTKPEGTPDVEDMHHPTGSKNYVSWADFPAQIGWSWGAGLPGDLTDGLQCVDCHTEWARSAHNWGFK